MNYDQVVTILSHEVNNCARRTEELGMTKKPHSTGRPALFLRQYYATISDLTAGKNDNGTYPIVPCFENAKGNVNVTSKIFAEVWLPKIHEVVGKFAVIPGPKQDEYSKAALSDNKLDAWVHRLDVLDPFAELGITGNSVQAQLAPLPPSMRTAAERTMKLSVIDLMDSVNSVYTRPPKNAADATYQQREANVQGEEQAKGVAEAAGMKNADQGKKRKPSTKDKQEGLKNVRRNTASAREDQRITVDINSDDEGPGAQQPLKSEGEREPNKRLNKNSTVLDDGVNAVKDLKKVMEKQYGVESKNAEGQAKLVGLQTKQVIAKGKAEELEKALKSAYDVLTLPVNHKDDQKTEMANLLISTGLSSPGLLLLVDEDFCTTLTSKLKFFPAKSFASAYARVKGLAAAEEQE
jgi:hypothetical protein